MYLRTTQRRNRDGSLVRYVQLAHNRRVDGATQAEVLVGLGCEDWLDREGLVRLVAPINRYLGLPQAGVPADAVELVDDSFTVAESRPMRTAHLLDGVVAPARRGHRSARRARVRAGSPRTWSGCCSR